MNTQHSIGFQKRCGEDNQSEHWPSLLGTFGATKKSQFSNIKKRSW